MLKQRRAYPRLLVAITGFMLVAGAIAAQPTQDFGSLADNLRSQLSNFGQLAGGVAALAGICMSILCLFKFRQYNANPQDPNNKLSTVLAYGIVGATLIALPEFMDVGITSLFGGATPTTTNFDGGNLLN